MRTARDLVDAVVRFGAWMAQHDDEIVPCVQWLLDRGPVERVLEIGAHGGGSTVLMCELAVMQMISVDLPNGIHGGLSVELCEARNTRLLALYPHFVGILGNSHAPETLDRVTRVLNGAKLDVLFIDGDHRYASVLGDYDCYHGFVRSGGVILFHDIEDTEYHRSNAEAPVEVCRLWRELQGEKHEFTIHGIWGGLGALVVP